jgi:FtsP/CotA-like multicopper oxidase with cupredoxin domain
MMKTQRRILAIVSCALAACGGPTEEEPPETEEIIEIETEPDPEEMSEEEEPEPEPEKLPKIFGVERLEDLNPDPDIVEVELQAEVKTVRVNADFELEMYTYNGQFPGPLLDATVGDEVIVHFKNKLPEPTTVHWHGLRISDEMDGNPRIQDPVEPGETFEYRFVVPDEGTYWYHPHVRGHVQIEKGLYAPMVVRAPEEERTEVDLERWVILDDILLDGTDFAPFLGTHMEAMHGRIGSELVTNGSLSITRDTTKVGKVERWRILNSANARTMNVELSGASFRVVGTDGGRVEPFDVDSLTVPVGQRYDLEVRYDTEGMAMLDQVVLARDLDGNIVENRIGVFGVNAQASDQAPPELEWAPAEPLPDREVDREETIVLDAVQGGEYGVQWRLNEKAHAKEPLFEFTEGETVRILLRNELGPEHPFHLHGQFFQIPGRPGLRDTVLVPGMETVEIVGYMDNPGQWMLHCHINEHAELGMMAEYLVNPAE